MTLQAKKPAILILADGHVFHGYAFGKIGTTTGEICFNTGMTGYQEVFTDPSYTGQVLIMNSVHIGNYGVKDTDVESSTVKIRGLIARNLEEQFSRLLANGDLNTYLVDNNLVAIDNLDTRALVAHIREKGAMNCIISSETTDVQALKAQLEKVPSMDGLALSGFVSCSEPYEAGDATSPYRIALLDFGVKQSIVRCLVERNCFVKVFPMNSDAKVTLDFRPDGIMYSNGPGDPSAMPASIALVNELIATGIPGFGICLGHQLIGLSQGLKTVKMFNGHRGINHPVKNLISGKSEITSQNHGFVISKDSIEQAANAEITHVHLNDQTVAGIRLKQFPVFSVQYHPEASAGPHDSRYLFDQFIANIANGKTTAENKRA